MTDAMPTDFGVRADGPRTARELPPEQHAAHLRLASLPTQRHYRKTLDLTAIRRAGAELAARSRVANGKSFNAASEEFGQRKAKAKK